MKTILTVLTLAFSVSTAFACSPPPALALQQSLLDQALNSSAYRKALSEQMNADFNVNIASITIIDDVVVSLSNGCVIRLHSHYKNPTSNGMCPRFVKVTANTGCNE